VVIDGRARAALEERRERTFDGGDERTRGRQVAAEDRGDREEAGGDPARLAAGFLDLTAVFGDDLSVHPAFRAAVTRNVEALWRDGVRKTLAAHLARS